ncbi:MAG: hypothetical protein ABI843_00920 [Dokdonella sp.]
MSHEIWHGTSIADAQRSDDFGAAACSDDCRPAALRGFNGAQYLGNVE